MEQRNFFAALLHLNEFYGITMTEEDFENMGLHAWDHIGNKNYQLYVCHDTIKDKRITLPCNVSIVEAVLKRGEDHITNNGVNSYDLDLLNNNIESYIESWKTPNDAFYGKGGYIEYQQMGSELIFQYDYKYPVSILYKGILADEAGLPMLNFKEVDAIAKYCAWIHHQKQAMITKDKATFEIAMMMRQQWQSACEDARTPIYLNQNAMDRILNAQSSWDRKRYGISYKPIR